MDYVILELYAYLVFFLFCCLYTPMYLCHVVLTTHLAFVVYLLFVGGILWGCVCYDGVYIVHA